MDFDQWNAAVQVSLDVRYPGSAVALIDQRALHAAYTSGLSPVDFVARGVPWAPQAPPRPNDAVLKALAEQHSGAGFFTGIGIALIPGLFGIAILVMAGGRAHHAIIEAAKLGISKGDLERESGWGNQLMLGLFLSGAAFAFFVLAMINSGSR